MWKLPEATRRNSLEARFGGKATMIGLLAYRLRMALIGADRSLSADMTIAVSKGLFFYCLIEKCY